MFKAPKLPQAKWQCNRCFQTLKHHHTIREAHRLVCEEIIDVTFSAAEEEGDDLFIDASVSGEEDGVTTIEQPNLHAWIETFSECAMCSVE